MSVRLCFLTIAIAPLALAGCRSNPAVNAGIDTMRAEYAALENDYFALEDAYFAKCDELKACRDGTETRGTETSADDSQVGEGTSGRSDDGDFSPPDIDFGTPGIPDIDFGTPVDPSELQSPGSPANNDGAGFVEPHNSHVGLPVEEISHINITDTHVTHLVVNPYLTTGHDFDSRPGDDGIAVLIEPRNGDDQLVPVAGRISIVVLDPALDGDAARVARWDFSAEEAARRVKTGNVRNRGISFKLPWPGNPPEHSKLHIFVRMETDEGKMLEANSEFYVILPGQFSQRWTPVSPPGSPAQNLAGQNSNQQFAAVPAQYTDAGPDAALRQDAHRSAVVNDEDATANKVSASLDDETRSPAQSRRPAWKPYR